MTTPTETGPTGTGPTDTGPTYAAPAEAGSAGRDGVQDAGAPLGTPAVAWVAVLLCLALVAAGLVALRELLVGRTLDGRVLAPGDAWLGPAAEGATSLVQGTTAPAVGAGVAVLGVVLLVLALRPRPRLGTPLRPGPDGVPLWVSRSGLSALASDAALGATSVETSRARVGRRAVDVDVSVDPRDAHSRGAVADDVQVRVEQVLAGLGTAPRVRVHVHGATVP